MRTIPFFLSLATLLCIALPAGAAATPFQALLAATARFDSGIRRIMLAGREDDPQAYMAKAAATAVMQAQGTFKMWLVHRDPVDDLTPLLWEGVEAYQRSLRPGLRVTPESTIGAWQSNLHVSPIFRHDTLWAPLTALRTRIRNLMIEELVDTQFENYATKTSAIHQIFSGNGMAALLANHSVSLGLLSLSDSHGAGLDDFIADDSPAISIVSLPLKTVVGRNNSPYGIKVDYYPTWQFGPDHAEFYEMGPRGRDSMFSGFARSANTVLLIEAKGIEPDHRMVIEPNGLSNFTDYYNRAGYAVATFTDQIPATSSWWGYSTNATNFTGAMVAPAYLLPAFQRISQQLGPSQLTVHCRGLSGC